jgi:hypothetical protein
MLKLFPVALCLVALSLFTACEEKPKTTGEKIEDKVKDGMDARPHEKLKDTGEDVKDAVKDATK